MAFQGKGVGDQTHWLTAALPRGIGQGPVSSCVISRITQQLQSVWVDICSLQFTGLIKYSEYEKIIGEESFYVLFNLNRQKSKH